jgi:hypothetical protein
MKLLRELLEEAEKKEKEKKVVFKETDPQEPFPNDTISALEKEIRKAAKDLDKEWKSADEVVDFAFTELEVPKPQAHLKKRWVQYTDLLKGAIEDLYDARGMKGSWSTTI